MFINCPHCRYLVALDEKGQPLARCPNCAAKLLDDPASGDDAATDASAREESGVAEAEAATSNQAPGVAAQTEAAEDQTPTQTRRAATDDPSPQPASTDSASVADAGADVDDPTPVVPNDTAAFAPDPRAQADTPDAGGAPMQEFEVGSALSVTTTPPVPTETRAPPARTWDDSYDPREPLSLARTSRAEGVNPIETAPDRGGAAPLGRSDDRTYRAEADADQTMSVDVGDASGQTPAAAADPIALAQRIQRSIRPHFDAVPLEPAQTDTSSHPAVQMDAPPATSRVEIDASHAGPPAQTTADAGMADTVLPVTATDEADLPADALVGDEVEAASIATAPALPAAKTGLPAPSFVRRKQGAEAPDRRASALRVAAIAALSVLLLLQLLLADRDRLATDARWRPLLGMLCNALPCNLPPWREPHAVFVVERDVRAHPSLAGMLRVTARMRNDARWPQPWPILQLTLSDIDGRSVATRYFQPREYLGGTPTQSRLASGQTAALSMDIVEPGTQAVAFTFDFH